VVIYGDARPDLLCVIALLHPPWRVGRRCSALTQVGDGAGLPVAPSGLMSAVAQHRRPVGCRAPGHGWWSRRPLHGRRCWFGVLWACGRRAPCRSLLITSAGDLMVRGTGVRACNGDELGSATPDVGHGSRMDCSTERDLRRVQRGRRIRSGAVRGGNRVVVCHWCGPSPKEGRRWAPRLQRSPERAQPDAALAAMNKEGRVMTRCPGHTWFSKHQLARWSWRP
jgi:hypothetical protein